MAHQCLKPQGCVYGRGVRTQVFSSPAPVLNQEVRILIRILFATQILNPNPEKIMLIYLINQCATIKNLVECTRFGINTLNPKPNP